MPKPEPKRRVTVYVMVPSGSVDEEKWELLCRKARAADLALDGPPLDERDELRRHQRSPSATG